MLVRRLIGLPSELLMIGLIVLVIGRLFARVPRRLVVDVDISEREIGPDNVIRVRAINYSPATGFALLLVGAAAVLTIAPDFVYLRDNFAVRINTVFKLYYQGWIMFSIAGAFAVWSVLAAREPALRLSTLVPRPHPPTPSPRRGEGEPASLLHAVARGFRRGARKTQTRQAQARGVLRTGEALPLVTIGRVGFALVVVLFFAAGLLYTVYATRARALGDTGRLALKERIEACQAGEEWAVNASGTMSRTARSDARWRANAVRCGEYEAIQCLD